MLNLCVLYVRQKRAGAGIGTPEEAHVNICVLPSECRWHRLDSYVHLKASVQLTSCCVLCSRPRTMSHISKQAHDRDT